MFPACLSSLSPPSPFLNPGITQSVFMDERREVFVLSDNNNVERRRVRNKVCVTAGGGGVCECVRGQRRAPPLLSCYSSSSLCFLPLAGPWPFLREPFWGLRRCPRSCSVHGTPPCPSSLSRSESECMRAEEVGAGTGFRRPGRWVVEEEKKRKRHETEWCTQISQMESFKTSVGWRYSLLSWPLFYYLTSRSNMKQHIYYILYLIQMPVLLSRSIFLFLGSAGKSSHDLQLKKNSCPYSQRVLSVLIDELLEAPQQVSTSQNIQTCSRVDNVNNLWPKDYRTDPCNVWSQFDEEEEQTRLEAGHSVFRYTDFGHHNSK